MTILAIGGFIIFFSVLINLLTNLGFINMLSSFLFLIVKPFTINEDIIRSVISGIFEITTGCNLASQAASAPFVQKLCATGMIIGFAGFSVHAQVTGIVGKSGISVKPYIVGKFIQSLIACFYTYIAAVIAGLNLKTTYAPIGTQNYSDPSFLSFYMLILCLIVVVLTWKK
jgi:nucleoside recognition membrane protein YjiH